MTIRLRGCLSFVSPIVDAGRAALDTLAGRLTGEGCGELPVIVGYVDRSEAPPRYGQPAGAPRNATAVLHRGEARGSAR
jgi:NAD+ synthase (glutamine-hydrolysing)